MTRKIAQQTTHVYKIICTNEIFENSDLRQILIYNKQLSVYLSVTTGIFVKKGEIESNFLTTPTEEPKLKNSVNTILNQRVIEPFSMCNYKGIIKFTFFLKFKTVFLFSIFDKTSSGGAKERYSKKNTIDKTPEVEIAISFLSQKF